MHVTVEDIAEAADVSPRTFFNYFPSKEAALFGADPERIARMRERVVHQAPGESALSALRQVLVAEARMITNELGELGGDPLDMLRRMKVVRADPHLRAAQSAHMANIECALAEALAERLGTDPARDPYPGLLASVASARDPRDHGLLGQLRRFGAAGPAHRPGVQAPWPADCPRTPHCARSA